MPRRNVLFDACQAITFASVGQLGLILGIERHGVAIGARASAEVLRDPAKSAVRSAIDAGRLPVEAIDLQDRDDASALIHYDSMPAFRGRGEAEVLAIAGRRGHLVGSDDQAVLRAARRATSIAGVVTSLDWIIWAIREGRIRRAEADALIDRLDVGVGIRAQLARAGRGLGDLL